MADDLTESKIKRLVGLVVAAVRAGDIAGARRDATMGRQDLDGPANKIYDQRLRTEVTAILPRPIDRAQGGFITPTELKSRGWSDQSIKSVLGNPDDERPNPHHTSGPKMKLYAIARVERAEGSTWFKQRVLTSILTSRSVE